MEMKSPTKEQLRNAWSNADQSTRRLLESLYGPGIKSDITDLIKLPIDAFRLLDAPHLNITEPPGIFQDGLTTFHKLQVITAALNEGWVPDWSNANEPKYFPWFDFQGGRFVFGDVTYHCTHSNLGSRLCFRTRELAEYAGQQFEDLYNDLLTF